MFLGLCFMTCLPKREKTMYDVESTKTKEHKRIPRTKVFAIIPSTYQLEDKIYRKNDQQYFTINESVGVKNMKISPDKIQNFIKDILKTQAGDIRIYEKMHVNNYSGIYFEGGFEELGVASVGIYFGNGSFSVACVGVYPAGDDQQKIDLMNILSSVYYDERMTIDPDEFKDFTFDESITGYKFSHVAGERLFYTPNGKPAKLPEIEGYLSFSSGPIQSELTGEIMIRNIILNMSTLGIQHQSKEIKKIKVGGRTAFLLETEMKEKEFRKFLYLILIAGEKKAVLMYALCNLEKLESPKELRKYRNKFHKTAQSIKF